MVSLSSVVGWVFILMGILVMLGGNYFASFIAGFIYIGCGYASLKMGSLVPVVFGFIVLWLMRIFGFDND